MAVISCSVHLICTWYMSEAWGGSPSLYQEDRVAGLRQPPGKGGASRPGAHDDVVMVRGRGRGQDGGQVGEAKTCEVRQPEQEGQGEQGEKHQHVGQGNHGGSLQLRVTPFILSSFCLHVLR